MQWRLALAAVVVAVLALWWVIVQNAPEYQKIPGQFRVQDFQTSEPSDDQLEALRRSIEAEAKKRMVRTPLVSPKSDAGSRSAPVFDAGLYETWVGNELLRRAETGESIPSDGSFDPSEALQRLEAGESREDVLGAPKP